MVYELFSLSHSSASSVGFQQQYKVHSYSNYLPVSHTVKMGDKPVKPSLKQYLKVR